MHYAPYHFVGINPYTSKSELSVLFAGHAQTEPEHNVGPQVLDYYLMHYVVSGKGRFQCLGNDYELKHGDAFFIFPGELVRYVSNPNDPWRYRWVAFKGDQVDSMLTRLGISNYRPVLHSEGKPRVATLLHQMAQTLHRGLPNCDLQTSGYMRLLLAEFVSETPTRDTQRNAPIPDGKQQVNQAIRWLTLQYSQPISIEQMAQTLGYHRTHLSKLFKQDTGMSPMEFLHNIRMERAKLLLLEVLTIEQVASSVGFTDALYFSKQFKKFTSMSPTEYRNRQSTKVRFDCSK